jgi:hypothetical protein
VHRAGKIRGNAARHESADLQTIENLDESLLLT